MSLKDSLKDIGLLIKAGKYDEAEQKVIAIEKAGNANTLIFLCGLRCATENGKLSSALLYLQKVKEADPTNPEINKAECSVYEKFPEQITKDSLSIIDKVIADEKISDARRANLKKVKWSTMIRLGLINEFRQLDDYSEAIKNVEICGQIVVASILDKKISQEMARTAFLVVKDELSQKHHLYGTLLFLNESEFDQFAFEHAIRFCCVDPNIMENVYGKIVYQLIKDGQISSPFADAVEVLDFIPQKKPTTEWLTHLFSNEVANAYDCLKKLSPDDYCTWPLSGLAFYTFFATRQFAMLIKLYRSTVFPDENIFKILELEAVFENYADEAELKQILRLTENSAVKDEDKAVEIKLRIKILLGICDENEINNSKLDSATKYGLLAELNFAVRNYSNSKKAAERCLEASSDKNQWRNQLILAKLKWMVDEDFDQAENDLRDLYSKNPFVADILAAMAEFYVALEEFDSAKQLIDHAVLVNPSNRAFRELQDNICAILKTPIEERIQNLNNYIALKPYSMWAVKHVTILEVQSGRFEEAINKLRRVIHALPDDVDEEVRKSAADIWAYVGFVNFHRGQARSTMYAFESAVSLEPDNPSFLLQLALAQKNLYKFDEVFATLQKLRSIKSASSEILKHSHILFLESLSLSAAQLIPGVKQLQQLSLMLSLVGAMPMTEWCSSRALAFSIAGALTLLRKYNNDIVDAFLLGIREFAEKCCITKKDEILNAEVAIILNLVSVEQNVGALNEAGVRLLAYATENDSQKLAIIARRLFRKTILLPALKSDIRSILYLNLGLTFCIGEGNLRHALHCFLRSLQLNKNNPPALSLIGLLCLKMENIENATQAFNTAHILEPLQVEHWCGRAMLSQLQNDSNVTNVMKNYQHSLTIKPCSQAVEAFAYYLIKSKAEGHRLEKYEFDFVTVRHLLYVNEHSDRILYSLATFAENFHHFNEAAFLINKVSSNLNVPDVTKFRMKTAAESASSPSTSNDGLERLYKIYHGELSDAVVAAGFKPVILIKFLLGSLANDSWEIFWKFYRAKFYPLLVGFVNALEMDSNWSNGIISTLRTNRPLHKFLEVFPVEISKHHFDPKSRRKEDDTFVLYDPSVEPLYELLSFIKAEYDSETSKIRKEEEFLPIYQPSGQSEFENGEYEDEV